MSDNLVAVGAAAAPLDDEDTIMDDPDNDEEEEGDFQYYYNAEFDTDAQDALSESKKDPEYFEFECLHVADVDRLLNESVEAICSRIPVTPSIAKVLLHNNKWNIDSITELWKCSSTQLLINARLRPPDPCSAASTSSSDFRLSKSLTSAPASLVDCCGTCLDILRDDNARSLSCGHRFCESCWSSHLEVQVSQRMTVDAECMALDCHVLVPEEFALSVLKKAHLREKYSHFTFCEYVKSHPLLRFCPGVNCSGVIRAKEPFPRRVTCKFCKATFCFKCGSEYHAPTDCGTIKKWLTKCADDSETANYISAHTKDCPKCHICIEKNGGCNHMQCYSCRHDFCWMCLGDWKTHGSEYYECSRYKENPAIAQESAHAQAREALKKYLFYYERWENHARSLRLEEQTLEKIKSRIQEKVMANQGTWIDWQYLLDAAALLAKCRYTLQFTYPYAYFLESGPRKELFEYQQAQLEAEIENLSWKIERAETTQRGELENQMDVAEKRRTTLLKDFLLLS